MLEFSFINLTNDDWLSATINDGLPVLAIIALNASETENVSVPCSVEIDMCFVNEHTPI